MNTDGCTSFAANACIRGVIGFGFGPGVDGLSPSRAATSARSTLSMLMIVNNRALQYFLLQMH